MRRVFDVQGSHPALFGAALTFVGNLLFPRLSHRFRWWKRLGPRDTALAVAAHAGFVVLLIRFAEHMAEQQRRAFEEVRRHLGREPTPLEVEAYVMARLERD